MRCNFGQRAVEPNRRFAPELAVITTNENKPVCELNHIQDQSLATKIKEMIINFQPRTDVVSEDAQMKILLTLKVPI